MLIIIDAKKINLDCNICLLNLPSGSSALLHLRIFKIVSSATAYRD